MAKRKRDAKGENTRNERGLCYMKGCKGKPVKEITYFGVKRTVCKAHEHCDGYR